MPVDLHLVDGTYRKHRHGAADAACRQPTGRPIKPAFVKGRAGTLWKEYRDRAFWLSEVESHLLAAWVVLTVEIEKDLDAMSAARISQWRALASELGFPPSARARFAPGGDKPKGKQDPTAEFFDD